MKNIYYEFFYLLSRFVKWANRRNTVYTFSGMCLLTMLMIFNVYAVLTLLKIRLTTTGKDQFPYVLISIAMLAMNYLLLNYRDKDVRIFDEYDALYKGGKQNKTVVPALVAYIIVSLAAAGYTAYLKRNHLV